MPAVQELGAATLISAMSSSLGCMVRHTCFFRDEISVRQVKAKEAGHKETYQNLWWHLGEEEMSV